MKDLQQIFKTIDGERDFKVRRANKLTLASLVKYLQYSNKGISSYDMDNFLQGNQFADVFQELLNNSIITENKNGNYILNNKSKEIIFSQYQENNYK